MYPVLPAKKEEFLRLAAEKLGASPIDFYQQMEFVAAAANSGPRYLAAGVLLLLRYRKASPETEGGEFVFVLIKRSAVVSQPGDLSCPGGMLHKGLDSFLRLLLTAGPLPLWTGRSYDLGRQRGRDAFRLMKLFLANALREAWEEIRLGPFNIRFLGPLPSYRLLSYPRMIFPLAAFIKQDQIFRLNSEVERIVEIPVSAFFDERNYRRFTVRTDGESSGKGNERAEREMHFPCLVQTDAAGRQDILWGATFQIILNFLEIVLGFRPPVPLPGRTAPTIPPPDSLRGRYTDTLSARKGAAPALDSPPAFDVG